MTDRSLVKKPRPVVFSLAELERYPTLEDRYAITLPFDDRYNRCWYPKSSYHPVCKLCERGIGYSVLEANCIKRTGERWAVSTSYEPYIFAFHQPSQSLWSLTVGSCGSNKTPLTVTNGKWFSAARDLDDECGERLGTLGYLPWEIRQEIMKALLLLDDDGFPCGETILEACPEDKLNYPFLFANNPTYSGGMRLASPSTRVEYEHCYLTETTFIFDEPRHLEAFLDKMPIFQQSLLRSFIIKLYPPQQCHGDVNNWVAVFARLPPNLVSIHFDVWSWAGCAMNLGGEWFVCDDSWYEVQPAIDLLDLLGKRARRFAARAKIGLGPWYDHPKHVYPSGEGWVRVLHELEPWSADWLKWWEEATKVASDDGEGASDMA